MESPKNKLFSYLKNYFNKYIEEYEKLEKLFRGPRFNKIFDETFNNIKNSLNIKNVTIKNYEEIKNNIKKELLNIKRSYKDEFERKKGKYEFKDDCLNELLNVAKTFLEMLYKIMKANSLNLEQKSRFTSVVQGNSGINRPLIFSGSLFKNNPRLVKFNALKILNQILNLSSYIYISYIGRCRLKIGFRNDTIKKEPSNIFQKSRKDKINLHDLLRILEKGAKYKPKKNSFLYYKLLEIGYYPKSNNVSTAKKEIIIPPRPFWNKLIELFKKNIKNKNIHVRKSNENYYFVIYFKEEK